VTVDVLRLFAMYAAASGGAAALAAARLRPLVRRAQALVLGRAAGALVRLHGHYERVLLAARAEHPVMYERMYVSSLPSLPADAVG
jgi:hypothetical protein